MLHGVWEDLICHQTETTFTELVIGLGFKAGYKTIFCYFSPKRFKGDLKKKKKERKKKQELCFGDAFKLFYRDRIP